VVSESAGRDRGSLRDDRITYVSEPRIGFGVRHPGLVEVLEELAPAASELAVWGTLQLRFETYLYAFTSR